MVLHINQRINDYREFGPDLDRAACEAAEAAQSEAAAEAAGPDAADDEPAT